MSKVLKDMALHFSGKNKSDGPHEDPETFNLKNDYLQEIGWLYTPTQFQG